MFLANFYPNRNFNVSKKYYNSNWYTFSLKCTIIICGIKKSPLGGTNTIDCFSVMSYDIGNERILLWRHLRLHMLTKGRTQKLPVAFESLSKWRSSKQVLHQKAGSSSERLSFVVISVPTLSRHPLHMWALTLGRQIAWGYADFDWQSFKPNSLISMNLISCSQSPMCMKT